MAEINYTGFAKITFIGEDDRVISSIVMYRDGVIKNKRAVFNNEGPDLKLKYLIYEVLYPESVVILNYFYAWPAIIYSGKLNWQPYRIVYCNETKTGNCLYETR